MTDATYPLTMEQIKLIYKAGMRRGSDEATSYDWGSSASGKLYDELTDELFDIFNHYGEIPYNDEKFIPYLAIEALVYDNR